MRHIIFKTVVLCLLPSVVDGRRHAARVVQYWNALAVTPWIILAGVDEGGRAVWQSSFIRQVAVLKSH